MSVIYKRFTGSVLSEILVAADVISDGSVGQALCGKHYKIGMRCLKLMYETLLQRLIRHCQNDGIVLPDYLKLKLSDNSVAEIINTSADIEND